MPTKKTVAKKPAVKKPVVAKEKAPKAFKFVEEVGRRKTATARVRISTADKTISVNGKPFEKYFTTKELQSVAVAPFVKLDVLEKFGFTAVVKGGGVTSQAEAVRHGIAKALTIQDPENRNLLKGTGYLTRDPRMRERKKFGLKRARRAPQWAKR
jgi:small subunit ribosomal protein S9